MTNLNPGSALELGTEMTRASWDATLRSGAQASAALAEISKLQSETLARLTDETLRTQNEMNELGRSMLAASARALGESLLGISRAMQEGGKRTTPEPPQTAEAGVRRREKAA